MLAALTDHVWQSTLIAVLAAGLALALRKHGAKIRYWLWFAASIKFLIPFSLLVALGGQFPWRVSPSAQPSEWQVTARRVFEPARSDVLFAPSFARIRDDEERSRADETASPSTAGEVRAVAERANASNASPAGAPAAQRSGSEEASFAAVDSTAPPRRPQPQTSRAAANASSRLGWQDALLAAWACGIAIVLGTAWRRWIRLRSLLRASRAASLVGIDTHGLEVRVTHAPIEPGVFGILRPVLVLPDGIVERLSRAQLDAIVRHERIHVARRDNLTALPQVLAQALFWFHPLVWWLGARLIAERERACDEAVLASGAEARAYAGGIVAVCEAYVASPLRCAAGVSGGPLERRVADILARRQSRALGSAGKYALLAMVAGVLAAPMLAGALGPRAAFAQQEPAAAGLRSGATLAEDDEARYLWAPLPGPPPLVVGYGRDSNERYFNLSLRECAIPAAEDDGDPDVGVPPYIGDFKALVRYAFDLGTDELVWRNPVELPGLQVTQYPLVRHSTCRAFLRDVLADGYSLETHEEDGRFVVDRIDVPAVPLSPWERGPQPPIDLEPAFLDRYVGYYYGYPEAFEREFAPVFRLRRDGTNLVLEWSGRSFELYAQNATRFSTHLRFEREPDNKPLISLSFETDDTGQRLVFVDQSRNVPQMVARPIDAQSAEALLSLIDEKIEHRAPSPFARALVDAIVARLDAAEPAGVALADSAAEALTERIERWRPGALVSRGKLASVLFREVLPSGREIYEATYENVAIRFDVVLALDGSVQGMLLDIACRMRHGATNEMAPCTAPFYVGEEPRVAVVPVLFSSLNLWSRGFVGGGSGERSALLSLRRCDSPESGEASTPSGHRVSGLGEPLSDFVRNVYHLEREELVWRVETDPSITVSLPKDAFDVSSTRSVDVPLTYACEAFARRGLSEELGLQGHFETRVLPAFELTRTVPDLRGLEPPTTSEPWVGREPGMRLRGRNAGMGTLAEYLGSQLGVRVFDRTNLPGNYDFTVVWDPGPGGGSDRRERDEAALLEGLRNAGFELVPIEIERDVLVVERLDASSMPRAISVNFGRF